MSENINNTELALNQLISLIEKLHSLWYLLDKADSYEKWTVLFQEWSELYKNLNIIYIKFDYFLRASGRKNKISSIKLAILKISLDIGFRYSVLDGQEICKRHLKQDCGFCEEYCYWKFQLSETECLHRLKVRGLVEGYEEFVKLLRLLADKENSLLIKEVLNLLTEFKIFAAYEAFHCDKNENIGLWLVDFKLDDYDLKDICNEGEYEEFLDSLLNFSDKLETVRFGPGELRKFERKVFEFLDVFLHREQNGSDEAKVAAVPEVRVKEKPDVCDPNISLEDAFMDNLNPRCSKVKRRKLRHKEENEDEKVKCKIIKNKVDETTEKNNKMLVLHNRIRELVDGEEKEEVNYLLVKPQDPKTIDHFDYNHTIVIPDTCEDELLSTRNIEEKKALLSMAEELKENARKFLMPNSNDKALTIITKNPPDSFLLDFQSNERRESSESLFNGIARRGKRRPWSADEVRTLEKGLEIFKDSKNKWSDILKAFKHEFNQNRSGVDLKDKARNEKRARERSNQPLGAFAFV